MKTFNEYISEEDIVLYLCRQRAKIAKQRNIKHIIHRLSSNPLYNYHTKIQKNKIHDYERDLAALLPPRKKWKKLGYNSRQINGQPLNSIDKNIKSILFTINYFKNINPQEPFLLNLSKLIEEIRESTNQGNYQIAKPEIFPKPKDDKNNLKNTICRPISLFSLKEKIIICLANKYLTAIFDKYFEGYSYAFRAPRVIDAKKIMLTHHDTIKSVKEYIKTYKNKKLWVAECDIMKFYDSVNHGMIRRYFNRLIHEVHKENPNIDFSSITKLFDSYLNCYSFNKNVLPYNDDLKHFSRYNIKNGKYDWVENELIKRKYYKSIRNAKIGIPQGGALSGLIANIVLDYADKQVKKVADRNLLYLRYCDDMIIIHPNKSICHKTFNVYRKALNKLKLIPYSSQNNLQNKHDSFWDVKSKSPFRWDNIVNGGFPWIGFVGYEINRNGDVRVRKRSLKKQMKKQYDVVGNVIRATQKNYKRTRNKTIQESVINRLIGMSIGRVKIWNAKSIRNDLCWINGFKELTDNKYTRIQMKRLDASRNKLMRKLEKKLKYDGETVKEKKVPRRLNIYYGKPFSYYFHVIEKRRISKVVSEINH